MSAGAWGAGSQEALTAMPPTAERDGRGGLGDLDALGALDERLGEALDEGFGDDLDEGLLETPGAWRVGTGAGARADGGARDGSGGSGGSAAPGGVAHSGRGGEGARPGSPSAATTTDTATTPAIRADGRLANSRTQQRRSGADPVKVLMHRHRDLCERAVDPLEIAAGLEARGVTDRTAARYRHKDVFSLAEEMYARMPRDGDPGELLIVAPAEPTGVRGAWAGLALLPGAVCALALPALTATGGTARLAVGVGAALAVAAALRTTLRHGPCAPPKARPPRPPACGSGGCSATHCSATAS
ncbi:hypothetical protein V2W30_26035 [Streptomyces sp. Q6]|uniref:Uncharacterized protein n=1 Tax=Streptomyces citrinus TaxID=3118173 RepID=A0ACD5AH21_9ACTN